MTSSIGKTELYNLHNHYESVSKDNLDFCYKYLNFYIGLLSAVLGATLTALLTFKLPFPVGLTLLTGPFLVIIFAIYGYLTVRVFYRRFLEAWITVINIETMLGLRGSVSFKDDVKHPLYESCVDGGFIAQFERPQIRSLLETAKRDNWSAEKLLQEVVKSGDTLRYAKMIFIMFCIGAIIFSIATLYVVLVQ